MKLLLDVKQKFMRVWADGLTEACERAIQKLLGVEKNRIATLNTLPIHAKKPAVKNLFWQIHGHWTRILSMHYLNNAFWLRFFTAESWLGKLITYTSALYIYSMKITIILLIYYLKLLSEISQKFEIALMIYHKHPIMLPIYFESRKTFPFTL